MEDKATCLIEFQEDLQALYNFKFGGERKQYEDLIKEYQSQNKAMEKALTTFTKAIPDEIQKIKGKLSKMEGLLNFELNSEEIINSDKKFFNFTKKAGEFDQFYSDMKGKLEDY